MIHYKGESGKKRKIKTLFHFYDAMVIFYKKHYKKHHNSIINIIVYTSIYLMFVVKLFINFFKKG